MAEEFKLCFFFFFCFKSGQMGIKQEHTWQSETHKKKCFIACILTFACREEAVHLNTAAWVGDTECCAGHQTLLRWAFISGAHQTPAWPLTGSLQQLHSLARLNTELRHRARHKVLQHHRQLTPTRELHTDTERELFKKKIRKRTMMSTGFFLSGGTFYESRTQRDQTTNNLVLHCTQNAENVHTQLS